MGKPGKRVPREVKRLADVIASEGFEYALTEYSDWQELAAVDPFLLAFIQRFRTCKEEIERRLRDTHGIDLDES